MADESERPVDVDQQDKRNSVFRHFDEKNSEKPELPQSVMPEFIGRLMAVRRWKYRLSNLGLDAGSQIHLATTHEVDSGTVFNLFPVFASFGIIGYFLAPAEPSIFALLLTVFGLLAICFRMEIHGSGYLFLVALLAMFVGAFTAKTSVINNHTVIIERQITAQISGLVLAVESNKRGAPRYLVKVITIEGLVANELPDRVRLSAASRHSPILVGEGIEGLARMQPVSGPVYPGGYDFSFFARFKGLGGSGFFMGAPAKSETNPEIGIKDWLLVKVNRSRRIIEKRIRAVLPTQTGQFAIALITGNRSGISQTTQNNLRKSGLAHILAISGLHMALVTLTVIWVIRLVASCLPQIVLHYPVKKWATATGFITATLYLFISGGGIATQRAWIMICVMLLAVMMDRRAITMRSVAVSATIVLALSPQNLFSPGFQMSFTAVIALVAGYEEITKRRGERKMLASNEGNVGRFYEVIKSSFRYLGGIAVTSLIAGTATAFLSAWHFHQIAPLGLVANLLAMPVVTILVMPLALLSVLLMPYGLEGLVLQPLGLALELVVDIARRVEEISPQEQTGLLPRSFLPLFLCGFMFLCILKTWLRLFGIIAVAMCLAMISVDAQTPDIIVSENGRAIAVKNRDEDLFLLYPRRNRFVSDIWLKAWGGSRKTGLEGFSAENCNKDSCLVDLVSGHKMSLIYDPALLENACAQSDILIAPRLWWARCKGAVKPKLVLTRYDFEQFGTHALYLKEVTLLSTTSTARQGEIRVETSLPPPTRPWHRKVRKVRGFKDGKLIVEDEK